MSAIRSSGTQCEIQLASLLRSLGFRFSVNCRSVVGAPDYYFREQNVAIFMDGDFWHARLLAERGLAAFKRRLSSPNPAYWVTKFKHRVARDGEVDRMLTASGVLVIRIWESDFKIDPLGVALTVADSIIFRARHMRGATEVGSVVRISV
jgi:DNA mismatch endonuclease (patch repair protein)